GILCFATRNRMHRAQTLLLWAAIIITVCAFLSAQSRGALLAAAVIITCVGVLRFGKAGVGLLLLFLLAATLIPNPLQQRIQDIRSKDPYAYTRLEIWKDALERIAEKPFGIGIGMYKYASFRSRFPIENNIVHYGKRAESAHSEYLQMAVELGIAGLGLFL